MIGRAGKTTLRNVYSNAIVKSAKPERVGGLVGMTRKNNTCTASCGTHVSTSNLIENCVFAGQVIAEGTETTAASSVGGILGRDNDSGVVIKNCLNLGTVSGTTNEVGGILGFGHSGGTHVQNCLNVGTVTGNSSVGAIVGAASGASTVTNCYYVEGSASSAYTGSITEATARMLSAAEAKGDVSELGLTAWTAYECDYPVPTGAKALFEQFKTPVNKHIGDGNNDHNCDNCGDKLSDCFDAEDDTDHLCDECGEKCGDHSYGEGVYHEATTERNAYYVYSCNCGHSYEEEIPGTKLFTITWIVGDETITEEYAPGAMPVYPNGTPTKAEDDKFTYTFIGWDPEISEVTGDATYTAKFEAHEKEVEPEYFVDFFDGNVINLELEDIVYLVVGTIVEDTNLKQEELLDRMGLLVWTPDESLTAETAVYGTQDRVFTGAKYMDGKYKVSTDGIPARNLSDKLTFRLYVDLGNGKYAYGKLTSNYSITEKYCKTRVNKGEWDAEVCRALLNYAAAAQEYFASNESASDYTYTTLANSALTEEQKIVNWRDDLVRTDWTVPEEKQGELTQDAAVITGRGRYLQLEANILVSFRYKVAGAVDKAEIMYWTEEQYNSVDVLTEENASGWGVLDENFEATYPGQPACDMFKTIYACAKITIGDQVYYSGVTCNSPERYAADNYGKTATPYTAALAKAMAAYGDAARTAFGK